MNNCLTHFNYQQGATLVTSMILVLVVTLLSLTAMQTTIFQEKMSSNTQNREVAFQASETGLLEAEEWLTSLTVPPSTESQCSTEPCIVTMDPTINYVEQTDAWWLSNATSLSTASGSGGTIPNITEQPRYRIEYVRFVPDDLTVGNGPPPGTYYFRATSLGTGANNDSKSIVQSTVAKRY